MDINLKCDKVTSLMYSMFYTCAGMPNSVYKRVAEPM